MAVEIKGKIYRNLQEQVEENMHDIEDLQDSMVDAYSKTESDAKYATKTELENAVNDVYGNVYTRDQADDRFPTEAHMNYVVNHLLQAEDTDYKTELVFEPDDAYLKYYDKDPSNPQDFSWGLVQKCFEIDRLSQRNLYAHNIQLTVKFKSQGVTSDTYTGRVNLTLYLPYSTQLTEETLKQKIKQAVRVSATGYAIETTNQYNYTVIALVKYSDQISTDLEVDLIPTNHYAASGLISANIGEITDFIDKVLPVY